MGAVNTNYGGMLGVIELVLWALSAWTALYLAVKVSVQQTPEWTIRIVTIVHAALITALSVLDWRYLRPWDIHQLGEPNTQYETIVLSITLGYFLLDLMWVIKYQTEGPIMYVHHVTSIACVSYILMSQVSGAEALLSISLLEGTNPCLQTRWFLRTHGYQGTWIHTITEYVFMVSFLLLRIVYGTYLVVNIVKSDHLHPMFKIGTVSLHLVSLFFVYQMFTYIAKKYFPKDDKKLK